MFKLKVAVMQHGQRNEAAMVFKLQVVSHATRPEKSEAALMFKLKVVSLAVRPKLRWRLRHPQEFATFG